MLKKISIPFIFLMFTGFAVMAQTQEKKPLDYNVYNSWSTLEDQIISNNGQWISYQVEPYKGDGKVVLSNAEGAHQQVFPRAKKMKFSPESDLLVFLIEPYYDSIRQMKLDRIPEEKRTNDSLGIYVMKDGTEIKFENVSSYKLAEEKSNWIAFQHGTSTEQDTASQEEHEPEVIKEDDAPKAFPLTIINPLKSIELTFEDVTDYTISDDGSLITFVQLQNDSLLNSRVFTFDTRKEEKKSIFSEVGLVKKLTVDEKGQQLAFIHTEDTAKTKVFSLYFAENLNESPRRIVDTLTPDIPEKWTVSEHSNLYFSENNERVFFGTSLRPKPEPKDTLLEEEKVKLDLWSWKDDLLQPQQLKNLEKEKKRSYLAVYHIDEEKVVQLADTKVREVKPILKGDGEVGIGFNYQPYQKLMSWEMPPYRDVYWVNMRTGEKSLVHKKIQSHIDISSGGNYFYWFAYEDSSWHVYNRKTKQELNLTGQIPVNFYDEDHDYPNEPNSYGYAGWTEDDEYFLVYDRYDLWKLDPSGRENPVNLTQNYGRKNTIRFRYIQLDKEAEYIDPKAEMLLSAFDEDTKASGFYTTTLDRKRSPEKLIMDDYRFYTPLKAKSANKVIWQKSSFKSFPDIWYSDLHFEDAQQISHVNPQQDNYLWGDVELVKWTTSEGTTEEGLLYKPENFDPDKKYPMVVYFYRLSSDRMHTHYIPKPSRSVINRSFYVSNGYLVFVPNIRYKTGYPGESAYNYVVGGTMALLNTHDYIDKDRLGIQGQSWGGYQVAHIITKTDMFRAASAGAPVSNMTSAYGGIRWGSGMSRMFQYEETQSRIGGTLWEKPLHYIENSPVFYAPRVNTPLLMRHNDGDGAVPWYQGIEYFVALRRLNKPVWMLNYNGAPHNEKAKSPNSRDLSIRMKQFFDHYLMDAPAPVWMEKGIPALKKGKTKGYELVD